MKPIWNEISTRALAHWKSTAEGAAEAAVLAGIGAVVNDHKTLQVALAVAAWRFVRGLLGRDVK